MAKQTTHLAVFISGSGSNLQSIIDHIKDDKLDAKIECVISNVPDVKGLKRAADNHIPTHIINHKAYSDKQAFEQALLKALSSYQIDLIILAGFMRILSKDFVRQFENQIINIHPSLLPKYKGLHTHARVLEASESQHGSTVHLVTPQLDSGKIIIQRSFAVDKDDTIQSLFEKVQKIEHVIYPLAIKKFVQAQFDPANL